MKLPFWRIRYEIRGQLKDFIILEAPTKDAARSEFLKHWVTASERKKLTIESITLFTPRKK
jgi:hypothetical protein